MQGQRSELAAARGGAAARSLHDGHGRLRRDGSPEPLQVAADLPPGFVRGDGRAVADLAQQFGIGQLGTAGGPMHGADQDTDVVVLPQQRGDLAERGAQLHGGGPERVGGLQPMATLHPSAAVLTGAECDPKLADDDPRDRQFFLELGGHARRADSSTASRTARRQRYVVADIDPGWPCTGVPAGRTGHRLVGLGAWVGG